MRKDSAECGRVGRCGMLPTHIGNPCQDLLHCLGQFWVILYDVDVVSRLHSCLMRK